MSADTTTRHRWGRTAALGAMFLATAALAGCYGGHYRGHPPGSNKPAWGQKHDGGHHGRRHKHDRRDRDWDRHRRHQ